MNIQIDFTKFKSLGSVYSSTPSDNLNNFEAAELLYKRNIFSFNESILKTLNLQPNMSQVGASILIPTLHYPARGFIKSLTFLVDSINNENCNLSLTKVVI